MPAFKEIPRVPQKLHGGVPKSMGTVSSVPSVRIIVFGGSMLGYYGQLCFELSSNPEYAITTLHHSNPEPLQAQCYPSSHVILHCLFLLFPFLDYNSVVGGFFEEGQWKDLIILLS